MKKTLRKTLIIGILTLFLTQIGFSQSIDKFINSTIEVDNKNVPTDKKQFYFPKEMFPEVETEYVRVNDSTTRIETKIIEGKYDDFVMEWYSQHLFAMKEPLLFNRKINKEIYRFTWLRTFHKPIAIRIEKENAEYKIYWKMLSGAGGYEPGKLITEKTKKLTEKEWLNFNELLKKSNFWKMEIGRSSIGNDGSEWILEGVNKTDYKVVSIWTPRKGNFYNTCSYLISLTDLEIKKKEKY
jgi:hypothetical protein